LVRIIATPAKLAYPSAAIIAISVERACTAVWRVYTEVLVAYSAVQPAATSSTSAIR
jgi:hypothetical protein